VLVAACVRLAGVGVAGDADLAEVALEVLDLTAVGGDVGAGDGGDDDEGEQRRGRRDGTECAK